MGCIAPNRSHHKQLFRPAAVPIAFARPLSAVDTRTCINFHSL